MTFIEAKNKFVQTWGALGSQWGINKTMAQIHALLEVFSHMKEGVHYKKTRPKSQSVIALLGACFLLNCV